MYNPINLILNGGYDIIQLENFSRDIFSHPYKAGFRNVMKNLSAPFSVINRYGWKNFISNELFPIELTKKGAQWWPNYQLHFIGGGMAYTAMYEWYDHHNFPAPRLFSIATMAAYHLLNEVIENGAFQGDNVDPIADIYFFNIGGIIFFSFDNINRFFSEELNLAEWSLMPSFSLRDGNLYNVGQYFSIKWELPFAQRWSFFYYFGMTGLTGLSYKLNNGDNISAGLGLRAKQLTDVDFHSRKKTSELVWNAGIFYDRENSLLFSATYSGLIDNLININVYPGVLKIGGFSPGLWSVFDRNGRILFGIVTRWAPGIAY